MGKRTGYNVEEWGVIFDDNYEYLSKVSERMGRRGNYISDNDLLHDAYLELISDDFFRPSTCTDPVGQIIWMMRSRRYRKYEYRQEDWRQSDLGITEDGGLVFDLMLDRYRPSDFSVEKEVDFILLRENILKLDERYQQVLYRKYWKTGMLKSLAVELGVSRETIKVRTRRSLDLLQAHYLYGRELTKETRGAKVASVG